MARRRWYGGGLFGLFVLACLLAGCAKEVPITSGAAAGDQSTVSTGSMGTGDQPSTDPSGRLDERDRSATEGRMSANSGVTDSAAAREAFLSTDVLFAYNSFTLTEEAKQLLEQKAQWMVQNPGVTVQLEGHCDERGTGAYNLALGERRANAVRQYMTALGVSAARITTISYGEEFPLDPGHDEGAWARNRRAHFAILNP